MDEELFVSVPSIKKLRTELQSSSKSLQHQRIIIGVLGLSAVLFLYLHSIVSSKQLPHALTGPKVGDVVIILYVLSGLVALVTYSMLAAGAFSVWMDLEALDRQTKQEDSLSVRLIHVPSEKLAELHERLAAELDMYRYRGDTLQLVIAASSGLLVGSLAVEKSGRADFAFWDAFLLAILFLAAGLITHNKQTLRRLSFVALKASRMSKNIETGSVPA